MIYTTVYIVKAEVETWNVQNYLDHGIRKLNIDTRHHEHWCIYQTLTLNVPWWRHQMETFSALLTLCAGNSPVTGEFPSQRPVTRSLGVFFDLRLSKRLNRRFETLSRSLWRHCDDYRAMQHLCEGPNVGYSCPILQSSFTVNRFWMVLTFDCYWFHGGYDEQRRDLINTTSPRQDGRHLIDDIFIQISLEFVTVIGLGNGLTPSSRQAIT